jgi:hypothetical protein
MTATIEATEITTRQTYVIPASQREAADKLVAKVNRRAEKAGLPAYTVEVGAPREVPDPFDPRTDFVQTYSRVVDFTVIGAVPRFAGWSFVGLVERDGAGVTTVRTVPGVDEVPGLGVFRAEADRCLHCNTTRQRRRTFLVRHDDGRITQVGSTCVEAFLGMPVRGLDRLWESPFSSLEDEDFGGGYGPDRMYETITVLEFAVGIIDAHGYGSRSAAMYGGPTATADLVWRAMTGNDEQARELRNDYAAHANDAKAAAVQTWAQAIEGGENTYLVNLQAIASVNIVTVRNFGILVSAVIAYDKAQGIERERAAAKERPSVHVGVVGQKWEGIVTVTRRQAIESYYGVSYLVSMTTPEGNVVKWFASNPPAAIVEGATVTVAGKVKKHDTWQGQEQTVVTRCKVAELTPAA